MEDKMSEKKLKTGQLSIHTENIFPIIKKWLYSDHDIFARELISNAIDAMNKRKALDASVQEEDLRVLVKIDKKEKKIEFIDYGIGMTKEEVEKYINQIAFSSAEEFIEKYKDKQNNIIGHFGLGFYSSFMVADKVTIDTLSWQEGAKPAFWECDGSTDYSIGAGSRKEAGTTVTVYLNKDSKEYLEHSKLSDLIKKYSNFMPFEIVLDDKVLNQKEALWNRKPKDVTEEEYKNFYKELFNDWQDPLFWIHLNVDHPFNLKGILYFPRIKNSLEYQKGEVKLYCNNVFVADNVREFIPEFLLLLKGGIDVPEIPLNVSRSFLQQDQNVKKISKHIIKKIGDYLKKLFKDDRQKFEEYWQDINQFIKYGALTEESFYDYVKDLIIFKTISGKHLSISEIKTAIPIDENKKHKIYYTINEDSQPSYLELLKEQGKEIIVSDNVIDIHLFNMLETKDTELAFMRIDSELNEELVDKEKAEVVDADNKTELERIKDVFTDLIGEKGITVEVNRLKNKELAGLIVFEESIRRMMEQQMIFSGKKDEGFPSFYKFVVNAENPIVKKVFKLNSSGKTEDAKLIGQYLHNLAKLEQNYLSAKDMKVFVEQSNQILKLI